METLKKFKGFVEEINQENGRLYKQSVLEKYKDDSDIKFYLHYVFSPYVITGISDKKFHREIVEHHSVENFSVQAVLIQLMLNNTGRDSMIGFLQDYAAQNLPEELHNIFEAIVTKNLSIGCNTKTINSIMLNCIEEFNVQLANKYFEDPARIEGKDFAITTKIDGSRIVAIKENGEVTFYTRQGQVYEGLVDLEEELKNSLLDNVALDGELTLLNKGELTSKDQYKETMKISRKDGEKHGLKMLVFDAMSAKDFRDQHNYVPYSKRRAWLQNIFFNGSFMFFQLLPVLYKGSNTSEIIKWLDYSIENGEEGIMLNVLDAPYEFTRTWNLQKVKKMQTLDLEVVDYFEGNKQFSGMLGGFIVRYKDGNTVRVGSGFDKEFRIEAWKDPSSYIGKIIEVRYFEETTNQNGGISLRFPVFVDVRTDKLEADF